MINFKTRHIFYFKGRMLNIPPSIRYLTLHFIRQPIDETRDSIDQESSKQGAAEFLLQQICPWRLYKNKKRLTKMNQIKHGESQLYSKMQSWNQITEKASLPTLPIIPLRSQEPILHHSSKVIPHEGRIYDSTNDDKVIPDYNFQSLFRKKSHIRLARKKIKEQAQKKCSHVKSENLEKEARSRQKGHWTHEQNMMYHWFLEIHHLHFVFRHLRRTDKIFKRMADFIQTRQAEQCRSHHQKMQKKYHSFFQILYKLRMDFYNTANPEQLKLKLAQKGYNMKEHPILSEQELRNGDLVKIQNRSENMKSEHSMKDSFQDDEYSSKQQDSLLGENYEKGLEHKLKYQ